MTSTNTAENNELYTLDEARAVLHRKKIVEKAKRKNARRALFAQRIFGIMLVIGSLALPVINNGDATASLIVLPLGIFAVAAKEKIME